MAGKTFRERTGATSQDNEIRLRFRLGFIYSAERLVQHSGRGWSVLWLKPIAGSKDKSGLEYFSN